MEQNELLENNENDNVLEFDYTGTDQAGNLADMAETLSQEEATAAIEAIESVRRKRGNDAVRDFRAWFDAALLPILKDFAELVGAKLTIRQDHFHDITAVFTGRCGPRNGCGWPWLRRIISALTGGPAAMKWNFL